MKCKESNFESQWFSSYKSPNNFMMNVDTNYLSSYNLRNYETFLEKKNFANIYMCTKTF